MLNFLKLVNIIKVCINNTFNIKSLEKIRIKYISKNGILSKKINNILYNNIYFKKKYGFFLRICKLNIENKIFFKKKIINKFLFQKKIINEKIDCTLPGRFISSGSFHPITKAINKIENFFKKLGFNFFYGPEIENVYYNFESLNIYKNHPAMDMHDTFWLNKNKLLRTQTSSMQVRIMEKFNPPIKALFPGKVFRNDYDSTHTPMFHQIEGLIIDKNINFSNLKWILKKFLYFFFEKNINIRFRSSYFPFTVPSAEVDIMKKNGKWLEILGCGMVHPKVLNNMNINNNLFLGCAFGIGIERIISLKYNISDIRIFFENDLRFLSYFK
ncbi:phenylalanine--tRNA ligase subunit alpha [Buchnera aphidicola]|uniref:phenylalanine--tRNA ligase subunit alpha n=1 Tax=Buchnera aphidicola TaxID=9 RepID=UPI0031B8B044